jgi:hypothetical protein
VVEEEPSDCGALYWERGGVGACCVGRVEGLGVLVESLSDVFVPFGLFAIRQ